MNKLFRVIAPPLLLLLTACAAAPPPPPLPPTSGTCRAEHAQFAVGHRPDARLLEQARVRSGARLVRTISPGQVVTMEFNPERLNLELDAAGRVVRVRCG